MRRKSNGRRIGTALGGVKAKAAGLWSDRRVRRATVVSASVLLVAVFSAVLFAGILPGSSLTAKAADQGSLTSLMGKSSIPATYEPLNVPAGTYTMSVEQFNSNTVGRSTDGLAAFDFHIFADRFASGIHTCGNIAVNELGSNVLGKTGAPEFGSRKEQNVDATKLSYIGKPYDWKSVSEDSILVFGKGTEVKGKSGGQVKVKTVGGREAIIGNDNKGSILDKVYIEGDSAPYIDIERELGEVEDYQRWLVWLMEKADGKIGTMLDGVAGLVQIPQSDGSVKAVQYLPYTSVSGWGWFGNRIDFSSYNADTIIVDLGAYDGFGGRQSYAKQLLFGNVTLTGTAGKRIIFNIDSTGMGSEFTFFDTNMTADKITNSESAALHDNNIVWNFYQRTGANNAPVSYNGTIGVGGTWVGSILAPNATVKCNAGLNGSIIAKNVVTFCETHKSDYTGERAVLTEIDLTVKKIWQDDVSIRPAFITLQLLRDDKVISSVQVTTDNIDKTGSDDYTWYYTFKDLPATDAAGTTYQYKVKELVPKGYKMAQVNNTIINTAENVPVVQKLKLTVDKKDGSGNHLAGATLRLTPASGQNMTGVTANPDGFMPGTLKVTSSSVTWVSSGKSIVLDKLPKGSYILSEDSAPAGYIKAGDLTVNLDKNKAVTLTNEKNTVRLSKLDGENNKAYLPGAALELTADQATDLSSFAGNGITHTDNKLTWSSTAAPVVLNGLPAGSYTLTETTAPAGYDIAAPVTFTVNADGTVSVNGQKVSEVSLTDYLLPVPEEEKTYELTVTKTGAEAQSLAGARLVLTSVAGKNLNDYNVSVTNYPDAVISGSTVTWTTGSANAVISGLPEGSYTLSEQSAPTGYEKAADISIYLSENKSVTMNDALVEMTINKLDEKSGAFISGAVLTLTAADTSADLTGVAVDNANSINKSGNVITFTTDGKAVSFAGLPVGSYTLSETTAPAGYYTASSVTFAIDEFGRLSGTGVSGDSVTMYDAPVTITVNKRYWDDKNTDNDIDEGETDSLGGATLRLTETGSVSLANVSGSVEITREPELDNVIIWQSSSEGVQLFGLPDGSYTLHEDEAPAGFDIAETDITFTVENGAITGVNGTDISDASSVTMTDKKTIVYSVEISKLDGDTPNALAGATLAVFEDKEGFTVDDVKAEDAVTVFESTAQKTRLVLPNGYYVLAELAAPEGYDRATELIHFEVVNGNVNIISVEPTVEPETEPEPEPEPEPTNTATIGGFHYGKPSIGGTTISNDAVYVDASDIINSFGQWPTKITLGTTENVSLVELKLYAEQKSGGHTHAGSGTVSSSGNPLVINVNTYRPFSDFNSDDDKVFVFVLNNGSGSSINSEEKINALHPQLTLEFPNAVVIDTGTGTETGTTPDPDHSLNAENVLALQGENGDPVFIQLPNYLTPEETRYDYAFKLTKTDENGIAITSDTASFAVYDSYGRRLHAHGSDGVYTYQPVDDLIFADTDFPGNNERDVTSTIASEGLPNAISYKLGSLVEGLTFSVTISNTTAQTSVTLPAVMPKTLSGEWSGLDLSALGYESGDEVKITVTAENASAPTVGINLIYPLNTRTSDGTLTVTGMQVGDYYAYELKAPSNYLPEKARVEFSVTEQNTASAPAEVSVANTAMTTGELTIVKTDDVGRLRSGARFIVYMANTDYSNAQQVSAYTTEYVGTYTYDANGDNADDPVTTFTTGDDGKIKLLGLPLGKIYYAYETAAPQGASRDTTDALPKLSNLTNQPEGSGYYDENNLYGIALGQNVTANVLELNDTNNNGKQDEGETLGFVERTVESLTGTISVTDTAFRTDIAKLDPDGNSIAGAHLKLEPIRSSAEGRAPSYSAGNAVPMLGDVSGATHNVSYIQNNDGVRTGIEEEYLSWSSGEAPNTLYGLPAGDYVLTETEAPEGYNVAAPIYIRIDADGNASFSASYSTDSTTYASAENNTIVMTDEPITGTITLTKLDSVNDAPIGGAQFTLSDGSGYVVATGNNGDYTFVSFATDGTAMTTDSSGCITVTGLPYGKTYSFIETAAADGYTAVGAEYTPASVELTATVLNGSITCRNDRLDNGSITLTKKDSENDSLLSGARFKLMSRADHSEEFTRYDDETYTTDENGQITVNDLPWGREYRFEELAAPDGYKIGADGFSDTVTLTATQRTGAVVMTNVANRLTVKKVKPDGSNLSGALLSLTAIGSDVDLTKVGISGATKLNRTTNKIIWESVSTPAVFTGLPTGFYTLNEEKAPTGYVKADPIYIHVTADGAVMSSDAQSTDPADYNAAENNIVTMTDEQTTGIITLTKLDSVNDALIGGAQFTLSDGSGYVVATLDNGVYTFAGINTDSSAATAMTTDSSGRITVTGLPYGKTYSFTETAAADGYTAVGAEYTPASVELTATVLNGSITCRNDRLDNGSITLTKKDSEDDSLLSGARFKLMSRADQNGQFTQFGTETYTTGADGQITVNGLPWGREYRFDELAAPDGYKIGADGVSDTVALTAAQRTRTIEMTNAPATAIISKQAVGGGNELPGADLTVTLVQPKVEGATLEGVTRSTGVVLSSDKKSVRWQSGSSANTLSRLPDGVYSLTETTAPDGYDVAETMYFKVENGLVYNTESYTESTTQWKPAEGAKVIMLDAPAKATISKQEVGGGDELVGAHLTVKLETPDENGATLADVKSVVTSEFSGDKLSISWISTSQANELTKLPDGVYSLTETTSPDGYAVAETIRFRVNNGKVENTKHYVDPEKTIWTPVESGTLIMYDAPNSAVISKRATGSGDELPGAELIVELLKAENTDATLEGVTGSSDLKRSEDKKSISWVSGDTANTLTALPDGEYSLTEITSPDGYAVAETIWFRVNNGVVSNAKKYDGDRTDWNTVDDNTVIMLDGPAAAIISKQAVGGGSELPGAGLTVTLVKEENTGTTLSGVTVSDKSAEFSQDKKSISWVSGDKPVALSMLPDGVYSLTETTAPDGYTVAERMYFKVENGLVYNTESNTADATDWQLAEDASVVMLDAPTKAVISKQAVGGGDELVGATLTVTFIGGEDETTTLAGVTGTAKLTRSQDGKSITWTSTSQPNTLTMLPDGLYNLAETSAPAGYNIAEQIRFRVEKGVVMQGKNENGTDTWSKAEDGKLIMYDAPIPNNIAFSFAKKSNLGLTLPNAVFKLTAADGTADRATSDANGVVSFKGLKPGKYSLTEESSPDGYSKSGASIDIIVDDQGGLSFKDASGVELTIGMLEDRMVNSYEKTEGNSNKDMKVGDKVDLGDDIKVPDGVDVTWTSDKPDIIKVDENGTVTVLKPGEATITAKGNGVVLKTYVLGAKATQNSPNNDGKNPNTGSAVYTWGALASVVLLAAFALLTAFVYRFKKARAGR